LLEDLTLLFRLLIRLVYRDVKKENVGFDVRGDVKIFDFGLSKCLSPELKARDPATGKLLTHGYRLTPRTGSIHTMAPEVASGLPYDEKCDVFSFAVLLWEMLALQSPFRSYTKREYMFRVVEMQERPWVQHRWPDLVKRLLREAWDDDPRRRPDMKRVSATLREELNLLTDAPEVKNRTIHMLNRSTHSFCLEPRDVPLERETDIDRDYSSSGGTGD
jgi:serine/threonine protein kinase